MEIKSVFTEEATRLLDRESIQIYEELRDAAINEALRSRGEPVEVTGSDVRKARSLFIKREYPLRPMTEFVLRVYAVLGIAMMFGGLFYPYLRSFLEQSDFSSRIAIMLAFMGLVLTVVSFLSRYYFQAIYKMKFRRKPEIAERERSGLTTHNKDK